MNKEEMIKLKREAWLKAKNESQGKARTTKPVVTAESTGRRVKPSLDTNTPKRKIIKKEVKK